MHCKPVQYASPVKVLDVRARSGLAKHVSPFLAASSSGVHPFTLASTSAPRANSSLTRESYLRSVAQCKRVAVVSIAQINIGSVIEQQHRHVFLI